MFIEVLQILICMVAIIGVIILNRVRLISLGEHQELKDSFRAGTDQLMSTIRRRYESLVQGGEDDLSLLEKVIHFRMEIDSKSRHYSVMTMRIALIIDVLVLLGGIALLVFSKGQYFIVAALAFIFLLVLSILKQMQEWEREETETLIEISKNLKEANAVTNQPDADAPDSTRQPPSKL